MHCDIGGDSRRGRALDRQLPGSRECHGSLTASPGSRAGFDQNGGMATWDDVVSIGTRLPEVEVSTWFRSPSLKVAGKGFARLRTEAEGLVVLMCDLDEKEALLASGDPAFTTTPHYDGYPAILVDLEVIDLQVLAEMVTEAWRIKAPARLRRQFDER